MAKRPKISIVGAGKVGTAMAVLASRCGWPVAAVGSRTPEHAQQAVKMLTGDVRAVSCAEAASAGELVMLTVRDEAIGPLCKELADEGAFRKGAVVAHCCGALGSEVLLPARERCGAAIASCHPLQTFPTAEAAIERLGGAYYFCEGDGPALDVLERFVAAIGGSTVRIAPTAEAKSLYHAGAVMACNSLVALIDAAVALMGLAGIDRQVALKALEPLVAATVKNAFSMGPQAALTGPIARGDVDTVRGHLRAMKVSGCREDLADFFRASANWTVDLAARKGTIDDSSRRAFYELLTRVAKEQ